MIKQRRHPWTTQVTAISLVAGQILLFLPTTAGAETLAGQDLPRVEVPPRPVKPNRVRPKVAPPATFPIFSTEPTDAEIFRARVFAEPIAPLGGSSTADERKALADAVSNYLRGGKPEDLTSILGFLSERPASVFTASLWANLGLVYRNAGYFSRAIDTWRRAWELARRLEDEPARAVANQALSGLVDLFLTFGHADDLEVLLGQVEVTTLRGSAAERVAQAREGLWILRNHHEVALPSGPTALGRLFALKNPGAEMNAKIAEYPATHDGATIAQMESLARDAGLGLRTAFRAEDVDFPVPAVVHLKIGHYIAVTRRQGAGYMVEDPDLGGERWLSHGALANETSGYALVSDPLARGWRLVPAEEGGKVRGTCHPPQSDARATTPCNTTAKGACGGEGMATYDVHALLVSLTVRDKPLWYSPPRGPAVEFRVNHNQREYYQPQVFTFSNVGPKWSLDWVSYVQEEWGMPWVYIRGGGREDYAGSTPHPTSGAVLIQTSASPVRYERRLSDGSIEVFALSSGGVPRRIFMTEYVDAQGQSLNFTYDAGFRLLAVTDAVGQVTTLTYGEPGDPLKVTRVTDPFGRFATIEYNAAGQLTALTDMIGIVSRFTYGAGDVVTSLATPYGTTHFRAGEEPLYEHGVYYSTTRYVEITDALGNRERVEWVWGNTGQFSNATYYWDKQAMAQAPNDYAAAKVMSWKLEAGKLLDTTRIEKRPLEAYVEYTIPTGSMRPSSSARILATGTTQTYRWEYNPFGHPTKNVDPAGRETVYEYDTNGIDLLTVKQKNGTGYDLLTSATYNAQHRPLTVTDISGQTTTFTYNAQGQVLTATNAKNETWTLTYDPSGYLENVTGPIAGATTTVTWDGYGRVRTLTNADSYTVTIDYDLLDRPTRISYPNGTYEEVVYDRLHPSRFRDLNGRWSYLFVDALGRPTSVRDPLGRTTILEWCGCGSVDKLIDARGQPTSWVRDLQGRVTKETRADNSTTRLVYETTINRLKEVTDAKGQVRGYQYFIDDRLKQVTYSNSPIPTPGVALTYDAAYGRLASRTDGTGATTYSYNTITAPPALGAGRLASIDGPLGADIVTYSYDELGRVLSRGMNGISASVVYDSLGRVTSVTNALGTFAYGFDAATNRLLSINGPGGLKRSYSYLDIAGDRQLGEIKNEFGASTVSKFNYTHDPSNQIASWTQQQGASPAHRYEISYDRAGQLSLALLKSTDPNPTLLKSYAYGYDNAGNRTSGQVDDVVTSGSHNSANQLTAQQAGGALRFAGTTDEPATVSVQGTPAPTTADNRFQGSAPVTPGPNTVTVTATDSSGNTAARNYQVTVGSWNAALTYDANGNLTSDGARVYTWDAGDRLVAIDQGTTRSEFSYDAFSRRTRIVEKDNGTVTSDKRFLWVGTGLAEERDATGANVTKRFFGQGVQDGGTSLFYAKDHIGSIREVVDSTGAVRARYDYDPYGRRTKTSGDLDADFGYTGHYEHAQSGLTLALYRTYDANVGRWLSRDPIGLRGGLNQYAYVENNPINFVDPLGLDMSSFMSGLAEGAAWGLALGLIAATGPIAAAIVAGIGIASLASSLYQMQTDECLTENQIHQMLGGMLGGLAGGIAGFKGGTALKGKAPSGLVDVPNSKVLPDDATPGGRPYTQHFTETGDRGVPGSVIDHVVDTQTPVPGGAGKSVFYDPVNDVTVVTGKQGIVSARKGPPRSCQRR